MLDLRALNRATLQRQLLLQRSPMKVHEAVEHLAGLQAQTPHTWYVGLWSRLAGFDPGDVVDGLQQRQLVRIAVMRSTIHLLTAQDAPWLRTCAQPPIDRDLFKNSSHGKVVATLDVPAIVAQARRLLEEKPLSNKELGAALALKWPDVPAATLTYTARCLLPLVQVPPRGVWGKSGSIAHTTTRAWLGVDPPSKPDLSRMVLRYLQAFGPATVMDVQTWCGLTRLKEIVTSLELVSLKGEDGQVYYDLPDAPRPDPDTPAPPRFLYDFDNILLSHADRRRVITEHVAAQKYDPHGPVPQLVLVDGFTAGDWKVVRDKESAALTVRLYHQVPKRDRTALEKEGAGLLKLLAPRARHEVRILAE